MAPGRTLLHTLVSVALSRLADVEERPSVVGRGLVMAPEILVGHRSRDPFEHALGRPGQVAAHRQGASLPVVVLDPQDCEARARLPLVARIVWDGQRATSRAPREKLSHPVIAAPTQPTET